MQNNIRKNQNEQIPSVQGRAAEIKKQSSLVVSITDLPQIQPVHTCVEQSPVCLIPDHKGSCLHRHCLLAYKKPQYWGHSIAEFYDQQDFSEFDMCQGSYGHPHIIPHNPNPGSGDDFEGFRQSQNAIVHLAGQWPNNVKVVAREHVKFGWAERLESIPSFNFDTLRNEWKLVLDVNEFAYYVGPTDGLDLSLIHI